MVATQKERYKENREDPESSDEMVPTLRDLPHEERLERLKLLIAEKRRERGDLIYRASKEMEKVDGSALFLWDLIPTRGHGKKIE